MKKKCLTTLITCLVLMLIFAGCSSEQKGVPESIVLKDASYDFTFDLNDSKNKIVHDVDKSTHTDTVTLIVDHEAEYGSGTYNEQYIYQYERANDLWKLLKKEKGSSKITLNEKKIISHSPYTGSSWNPFYCINYSITFTDIDLDKMTAKVKYTFSTSMDDVKEETGTISVDLQGSAHNPYFDIPYMELACLLRFSIGLSSGLRLQN